MSNLNTYSGLSPNVEGKAQKRLLKRGQYEMVTERFGTVDPQPKNASKTRKWRRYHSLPRAIAPLAEGIPPEGQKLAYTDIVATLEQFGDFVEISDVIQDTHTDPILNECMDLCGEQAGETMEVVRFAGMKAGTNVFYANGVASRALTTSPPTRGDFRKIFRYFAKYKAKRFTKIISATAKVATEPVASAYWALGSTDLLADLKDLSGFTPVENYSSSEKAVSGEVGKIEEFRIVLSPLFEPWLAGATSISSAQTTYLSNGAAAAGYPDVYPLLCIAKNSYAIVPLQGYDTVKIAVIQPNKPSKTDPMGQKGMVSWKTWQAPPPILNETWIARLECCATASPS